MFPTYFEAENIAGDVEGVDLAAAVAQEFAGADDARDDLEKDGGIIAFAVNFPVLDEMLHSARRLKAVRTVVLDRLHP